MSLSPLDCLGIGNCCKCNQDLTTYHKIWQCEEKHITCCRCFAAQMHRVNIMKCSSCSEDLKPVESLCKDNEHVFIFVDDSNVWIEAKKLAAKKLNLKSVEDPRLRMDIGKITDVVANNRKVAWGTLYGSEPPPLDSVWQKIKKRGWKVFVTPRSTLTGKEKQLDQQIVSDITALISGCIVRGKIVIMSGDADMIPAIKRSLQNQWSIEIWTWENSVSNSLSELARGNSKLMSINILDSRLEEVTFTDFKFRGDNIPNTRTVIIKDIGFTPNETWQKKLGEELGWPFQICMIGPEKFQDHASFKDVILIFANARAKDGKDFEKRYFDKIFEDLKQKYPGKILNHPAYLRQFRHTQEEICLANKFEALKSLDEQLSEESPAAMEQSKPSSYGATGEPDEDDENVESPAAMDQSKPSSYGATGEPDEDEENVESPAAMDQSKPSSYGATGEPDEDEEKEESPAAMEQSKPSSYGATGEPDEDDEKEEFQVVRKRQKKKTQKYSTPCEWRSKCKWRGKCKFHHTDDEKEFFKNPYKYKKCAYIGGCKHGPSRCNFAHSDEDSFCTKCHSWGHLKESCPTV